MRKNIGIILAGGSGHRVGSDIPKQFLPIAGKTVLEHTLSVFHNHRGISEIIIVANPACIGQIRELAEQNGFCKVSQIVGGGAERYHSTLSALQACGDEECNLIIHDAVRPLVTAQMIDENIAALATCDACTTAVPATDTMLESDPAHDYIRTIPDRSLLYNIQTPQSFKKSTLQSAYSRALEDPDFQSTDDCGVVKKYLPDTPVKIVKGSPSNMKLTYKEDIAIIEVLLKQQQRLL